MSLNIRLGWAGGLDEALRSLHQGNVKIGVLHKTKLTKRIHKLYSAGYKVWATEAERRQWDRITIVCREEAGWKVEGATSFVPHVEFFTITAGQKRWYVVGKYVPPNDQLTVHQVEQALARFPEGVETLLVGDLNARLAQPWDQCEEDLATKIANCGIVAQILHFIPRWRYRGKVGWSWRMWRDRRHITGRGDYILGTDHRDFYNLLHGRR